MAGQKMPRMGELASLGPEPKHVQVREALRLATREMEVGAPIDSERELMRRFAVSRTTIRLAIQALVDEGLLQKSPSRGTFVTDRRVESHLHLASFTEDMLRRGHAPSTEVISIDIVKSRDASRAFFVSENVWRIERSRLADSEPMAHEITYIDAAITPNLDQHDLTSSLYRTLREQYGLVIDNAEQRVTAVSADAVDATRLKCRPQSPLLLFNRHSHCNAHPIERTLSWYLGDRYALHIDLNASMSANIQNQFYSNQKIHERGGQREHRSPS